ncbi:MAG: hypothetical protein ABIP93_13645 [Gemmatimonadaceae bacterium]
MGLTNIHQMDGLKNWRALCFNLVAAVLVVAAHRVQWPMALTMSVGTVIGDYGTSGDRPTTSSGRHPRYGRRVGVHQRGLAAPRPLAEIARGRTVTHPRRTGI